MWSNFLVQMPRYYLNSQSSVDTDIWSQWSTTVQLLRQQVKVNFNFNSTTWLVTEVVRVRTKLDLWVEGPHGPFDTKGRSSLFIADTLTWRQDFYKMWFLRLAPFLSLHMDGAPCGQYFPILTNSPSGRVTQCDAPQSPGRGSRATLHTRSVIPNLFSPNKYPDLLIGYSRFS